MTIPEGLRDSMGLQPGVTLDFTEEEGRLVARKVTSGDPFAKWRGNGRLPASQSVDDDLAESRDGR